MPKRWKIFVVLAFMYILAYFYRVSMAVVAKDLSLEMHLDAARLGNLSSLFFYAYAFVQVPLGPLIDRLGGRRIIILSGLLTICGTVLFAVAPSYPMALSGRVLMGIGTASVLMASLKIYGNWFSPQEFATISGFMVAVGNLGNLSATAPLAAAVSRFGWRYPFLAVGVLQAAAVALVCILVTIRPRRGKRLRARHSTARPRLRTESSKGGGSSLPTAHSGCSPSWLFSGTAHTWCCKGSGAAPI